MSEVRRVGLKARILERLYAFIPRHVSNRLVLWVMQCMRRLQRHGSMYAVSHYELNRRNLSDIRAHIPFTSATPFVENQLHLDTLCIGMSTMDRAGCEVIAVYNALKAIGIADHTLPELIEDFERDGIIRSGRYGVSAVAMRDRLRRMGIDTEMTTISDRMGKLLGLSHAAILTMYNDRRTIAEQIHSVCISREPDGYTVHNMYGDGRALGPYRDWDDIRARLHGGLTGPIAMIGIRDTDVTDK